jgi:hypothetical protein
VATTTLDSGAVTDLAVGKRWRRPPTTLDGAPAPSTTYYYRTTGGTRASTTDAGSIPAGTMVEHMT